MRIAFSFEWIEDCNDLGHIERSCRVTLRLLKVTIALTVRADLAVSTPIRVPMGLTVGPQL